MAHPPPKWTASRKAVVIAQHLEGGFSEEQIYALYQITGPELREWCQRYKDHGLYGLKTTKVTRVREKERRDEKRDQV